ncbi:hypothetical protein PUNSTDRAFT_129336 [Punctularia strigosozonata HHB-11173 SS5]|uniref:uncharacterized protein n=1 Tax=Punctularia strigosozonata (strain HHB-11173) TaxID=741275 RepID=UPI0004418001|nr:uncharacterized protein PUNSTDRAFT_129336 [Punctularia strigosozonata HHB-11173 SS5]EIN13660.1 hypothetical protein PUNSTDRAFT_129336 [Punctularia strigosozonata HHB-11173 SS5]
MAIFHGSLATPLPITPKREALELGIPLVPLRKRRRVQETAAGDAPTHLAPVHLQELWNAWHSDSRVPTVESRRAWAVARNVAPAHVHTWFNRRKIQAKKKGTVLSDGTYDLLTGSPPDVKRLVAVKKEASPETPTRKKGKMNRTPSQPDTSPFFTPTTCLTQLSSSASAPDLIPALLQFSLQRPTDDAYTQPLSEPDYYGPSSESPLQLRSSCVSVPNATYNLRNVRSQLLEMSSTRNSQSAPVSSLPPSSPCMPSSSEYEYQIGSESTAGTSPAPFPHKIDDQDEAILGIVDPEAAVSGVQPSVFIDGDSDTLPAQLLQDAEAQIHAHDTINLNHICNQGVPSRSDFRCDLCAMDADTFPDLARFFLDGIRLSLASPTYALGPASDDATVFLSSDGFIAPYCPISP